MKGIIYIMTTAVPGLIKIGKTGSTNFERRMYDLEHNGYRNVTALKRSFAIEVDDYGDKEDLLHNIFAKSRLSDTELFALDIHVATQLLASFEGRIVYPKTEAKEEIFDNATDAGKSRFIPDGTYVFSRHKKSDDRDVHARARVEHGRWTLLKGSVLGTSEDAGVSQLAREIRSRLQIAPSGKLLESFELSECSPSLVGTVVMNQSNNGWTDWKTTDGRSIDVFRQHSENR